MSLSFKEYSNFLSIDACNSIIDEFRNSDMGKGGVVGGDIYHRTSTIDIIKYGDNSIVDDIYHRISNEIGLPIENIEYIQVNRYKVGEYFKVHSDWIPFGTELYNMGGQRLYTFLIYLNSVNSGGETHFPSLDFQIVPEVGKAISWNNTNGKGSIEHSSLHESLEVLDGEKWILVTWIRENRFIPSGSY